MGKTKTFTIPYLSLDFISKIVLALFIVATILLMFNDRYILRFIPQLEHSFKKIARVKSVKGDVMRKISNDSLYLPIFRKDNIFESDFIVTGDKSMTELQIDAQSSIITEPNSAIRMKIINSKLTIYIQNGAVITNFSSDRLIDIKIGIKTIELQIKKGLYLIKNSAAGIQVTSFSSNNKLKKSNKQRDATSKALADKKKEEETAEQDRAEAEQNEIADKALQEAEAKELKQLETPLQLPYPENNTIFFVQNPSILTLAVKSTCFETCSLRIFKNKKLLVEKTFTDGQVPIYKMDIEIGESAIYDWVYEDLTEKYELNFEVQPFSAESFDSALKLERNIEVL